MKPFQKQKALLAFEIKKAEDREAKRLAIQAEQAQLIQEKQSLLSFLFSLFQVAK